MSHEANSLTCHRFVRVAWLHWSPVGSRDAHPLLCMFTAQGMEVWLFDFTLPVEQVSCFDLILVEEIDRLVETCQPLLARIRLASRAPLVVLAHLPGPDRSIELLHAGADVVLPLDTPHQVIFSRCEALLRRWRSLR